MAAQALTARSRNHPQEWIPVDAIRRVEVDCELREPDGRRTRYRGEALEWDLSKSDAVALFFTGLWFLERSVHVAAWSTTRVELRFNSDQTAEPRPLILPGPADGIPVLTTAELQLEPAPAAQSETCNVSLSVADGTRPVGHVLFAIDRVAPDAYTSMHSAFRWTWPAHFVLLTWVTVLLALFAFLSCYGLRGYELVLAALPAIPAVLAAVGWKWAELFDLNKLALVLSRRLPRRIIPWWTLVLVAPLALFSAHIALGLYTAWTFRMDLQDQLKLPSTHQNHAVFFCNYPERLESRALLARQFIDVANDISHWGPAIAEIRRAVPIDLFLSTCLSRFRKVSYFTDDHATAEDEARAFYASLIWNYSNEETIDQKMQDLRRLLGDDPRRRGPVAQVALANYELKLRYNFRALPCTQKGPASDCAALVADCRAGRDVLEKLLADSAWKDVRKRSSFAFLEARDMAATVRLAPACGGGTDDDIGRAIRHYDSMFGAIPREPKLDQSLSQINLRNLVDALLDEEPSKYTAQAWKKACENGARKTCERLKKAMNIDGAQQFFQKDRFKRRADWNSPTIAAARGSELASVLMNEAAKNWRNPCVLHCSQ